MVSKDASQPTNEHELPAPFGDEDVPGDIILTRSDANGQAEDFTLAEYAEFCAAGGKVDGAGSGEEEESEGEYDDEDDEDDSDDEEEDSEGDDDDEDGEMDFKDMMMGKLVDRFEEEHGRKPTEKEGARMARQLLSARTPTPPVTGTILWTPRMVSARDAS